MPLQLTLDFLPRLPVPRSPAHTPTPAPTPTHLSWYTSALTCTLRALKYAPRRDMYRNRAADCRTMPPRKACPPAFRPHRLMSSTLHVNKLKSMAPAPPVTRIESNSTAPQAPHEVSPATLRPQPLSSLAPARRHTHHPTTPLRSPSPRLEICSTTPHNELVRPGSAALCRHPLSSMASSSHGTRLLMFSTPPSPYTGQAWPHFAPQRPELHHNFSPPTPNTPTPLPQHTNTTSPQGQPCSSTLHLTPSAPWPPLLTVHTFACTGRRVPYDNGMIQCHEPARTTNQTRPSCALNP